VHIAFEIEGLALMPVTGAVIFLAHPAPFIRN
jgi:hypothetical protein